MGIFGTMTIMSILSYLAFMLVIKIVGSTQKENKYKSTDEAIQRDTDEFNRF